MWLVQGSIAQCVIHGMAHDIQKEQCASSGVTWRYQEPGAGVGKLDWIHVRHVVVAMYSPGKDVPAAAVLPNSTHQGRNVNSTYLFPIADVKVVYRR
jgi:hypothetical protein